MKFVWLVAAISLFFISQSGIHMAWSTESGSDSDSAAWPNSSFEAIWLNLYNWSLSTGLAPCAARNLVSLAAASLFVIGLRMCCPHVSAWLFVSKPCQLSAS
jgi:hypothetical protein